MRYVHILAISGSLRRSSTNSALLRVAAAVAGADTEVELWPGLRAIPAFDEDDEERPAAAVTALRRAVTAADGLLIATPEYNHSVPGHLKNAVDWLSRPYGAGVLTGTPAAVIGASASPFGAAWAQAELRKVLGAAGARVVDAELAVGAAHEAFTPDGGLRDPLLGESLAGVLDELARAARITRDAA